VSRDELFPRPAFRRARGALDARPDPRRACRVYVGLLRLAASNRCGAGLAERLDGLLETGALPDLEALRAEFAPPAPVSVVDVAVPLPDPAAYDALLAAAPPAAVDEVPHDRGPDAAKLPLMLASPRRPTIGRLWQEIGTRADAGGWGSARFLATLCEHEIAERTARRAARHPAESGPPAGKTFATFGFAAARTVRKAHALALARGDVWLEQGANILIFGPSLRHRRDAPRRGRRRQPDRGRQARPVHSDHRPRATAAGRTSSTA
jgi:IstB-like ATP binding protein